jgi:phage FluMu gp28-like protein
VLDEYGTMKPETWMVIEPIIRANGGWVWFIGTPKGKNHFYSMYLRGLEGHHQWKSYHLQASKSGIIPFDELAESKKSMAQADFNQEWECEFLEGQGSVFRQVRDACTATEQEPISGHIYVMGVDLAKVQDWTVISIYDRSTNAQVYQDRFQTIEWPFQKARIQAIAEKYNRALVILDATGIGDPIADDLLRAGVSVEPFKISEPSKKELIEKLSIWIEQKKVRILNREDTLFEFDNFTYEIGATGKIRYGARDGLHDDIVIAHALAVSSLSPLYKKPEEEKPTMIQLHKQSMYNGYDEHDEWREWDAA